MTSSFCSLSFSSQMNRHELFPHTVHFFLGYEIIWFEWQAYIWLLCFTQLLLLAITSFLSETIAAEIARLVEDSFSGQFQNSCRLVCCHEEHIDLFQSHFCHQTCITKGHVRAHPSHCFVVQCISHSKMNHMSIFYFVDWKNTILVTIVQ